MHPVKLLSRWDQHMHALPTTAYASMCPVLQGISATALQVTRETRTWTEAAQVSIIIPFLFCFVDLGLLNLPPTTYLASISIVKTIVPRADINECDSPSQHRPCINNTCTNTIGSYNCSCPAGTQSNDPRNIPCSPIPVPNNKQPQVKVVIGIFWNERMNE